MAKCHGSRSEREKEETDIETRERGGRERSCLPCSLGDSVLASLQFACTGLPKAAASQAIRLKLGSHWMGGAPLVPHAAQQCFIGLVKAGSWSSPSDWLGSTALLHRGFTVADTLSMDT